MQPKLTRFVVTAGILLLVATASWSGPSQAANAGASASSCSFTGSPAVAFVRRNGVQTGISIGQDIIVSDRNGGCQVLVYSNAAAPFSVSELDFHYTPDDSGGGLGRLIWFSNVACAVDQWGLQYATIEVDGSGTVVTPLPLSARDLCMPDGTTRLFYPSISPSADRVAFGVAASDGARRLAIAPATDGRDIANGIDLDRLEYIASFSADGLEARLAWSPTGTGIYLFGGLQGDTERFIYALTESGSGWTPRKLVSGDFPVPLYRALSATRWNHDGSGPREVLAFSVVRWDEETGWWLPVSVEIIDVLDYDDANPQSIVSIGGGYAFPRFTSIVSEGTAPNLFVLDTRAPEPAIVEIDPTTGACIPVGGCLSIGPTGSSFTHPASAIEFATGGEEATPTRNGALPVVLDLLLRDDEETTN